MATAAQQADMLIRVRIEARDYERKLAAIEKRLNAFQRGAGKAGMATGGIFQHLETGLGHLEKFGKNLQWAGRQLEFRFTLPLVIAGAAATKFALDNERAFTKLKKVYGSTDDDLKQTTKDLALLQRGFRALSDIYGVQQSEVINIGAEWAAAGAKGTALAKVTRLTLDAMILGDQSYEDAASSLIALRTQYGMTADELKTALETFNIIENETAVHFDDLIDATIRGGSTANAAGIDYRTFAAYVAALVPAVGSATKAGNSLKTIISRVMAPTTEAIATMKEMGINLEEFMKLSGDQRLDLLAQKFKDLDDAQRVLAATQIFGRYQLSAGLELMKNLTDAQSAYNKALEASKDPEKNRAQYVKELGVYLRSTPQAFEIVKTRMQNLLAEAIMPLLPAILGVAQAVVRLLDAFTNLDPQTQTFILFALAALAVLGPLISYLGAFALLIAELGKAFLFPIKMMNIFLAKLLAVGTTEGLAGFKALFAFMRSGSATAAAAMVASTTAAEAEMVASTAATGTAISAEYAASGAASAVAFETAWEAAFIAGGPALAATAAAEGAAVGAAVEAGVGAGIAGGIPILIGAAAVGLTALAVIFKDQIWNAVKWVGRGMAQLPKIFGDALIAVFKVVVKVGQAIYQALLDFLNPFQRHSPSLVDLVTEGMDVIADKYKSLGRVSSVFNKVTKDLRAFKDASAGAFDALARQEIGDKKIAITTVAPGAGPSVDALIGDLDSLNAELRIVTKEYGAQQIVVDRWEAELNASQRTLDEEKDKLDGLQKTLSRLGDELDDAKNMLDLWAGTPLEGMKAMSDAIFENEMAQKRLNLELLKLEEAGKSIDDVQAKMAALNGEIEKLGGERESLRLAGAGSDVLGPIDDQIDALRSQQRELDDTAEEIGNLQDQLEELRRQGQIMDLEESLKFDPLTRQIQDAADALQELPFDMVLSKTKEYRERVDELTDAYGNQQVLVDAQSQKVDELQAAHDNLNDTYDAEKQKLEDIGALYDALNDQISAINQALDTLANKSDAAGKMGLDAAAGGDFDTNQLTAPFTDPANLDELVKQWEEEAKKAFGNVDFGDMLTKPFTAALDKLKNWWDDTGQDFFIQMAIAIPALMVLPLTLFWASIWAAVQFLWGNKDKILEFFEKLPGWIIDKLAKFGNMLVDWLSRAFRWAISNGPRLLGLWMGFFVALPFKIILWMGTFAAQLIMWAIQAFMALLAALPGAAEAVLNWFRDLPGNILASLEATGKAVVWLVQTGWDILQGLWQGLVNFWPTLVEWFTNLPKNIGNFFLDVGKWLVDQGSKLLKGFLDGLGIGWPAWVAPFFNSIKDKILAFFSLVGGVASWLIGVGGDLIRGFFDGIQNFWNALGGPVIWFASLIGRVINFMFPNAGGALMALWDKGYDLIQGFLNGLRDAWKKVTEWVTTSVNWFKSHFSINLGIHSPSTIFAGYGRNVMEGFAIGLDNGSKAVEATMDSILSDVMDPTFVTRGIAKVENYANGETLNAGSSSHVEYNFYGDLSFPAITSPNDAKKFIDNLESLVD